MQDSEFPSPLAGQGREYGRRNTRGLGEGEHGARSMRRFSQLRPRDPSPMPEQNEPPVRASLSHKGRGACRVLHRRFRNKRTRKKLSCVPLSSRLSFRAAGRGVRLPAMTRPGKLNLLTDVDGLTVGQAEDHAARSGVTIILADRPVAAAVDVRGGAPGTIGTDALDPVNLVGMVDAIALSGGSSYGPDAAGGVMAWLGARGRGFRFAPDVPAAPIAPGAIIFDLANGGNKNWGADPPYRRLALPAVEA